MSFTFRIRPVLAPAERAAEGFFNLPNERAASPWLVSPENLRDVSGFKDNFLSALLEGLHKELSSRYQGSSLFVEGIAQSLAVHLVRTYADETTPEYKGGLPGFRLRKVRDLMVTHLEDQFSLIRLAREAGMSEFHFSRAFKRTTGIKPSQYFIDLRMERARRLLRETKRSIIEIGLNVGYTSPSHFARIFRREVGISASEYRRSCGPRKPPPSRLS